MPLPERRKGEKQAEKRAAAADPRVAARAELEQGRRLALGEELEILAGAPEQGEGEAAEGVPRFRMTAYSGNPMAQFWLRYPIVVDLAGMRIRRQSRPVHLDHLRGQVLGHTTAIEKSDGRLVAEGVLSGDEGLVAKVTGPAQRGFPWQASIGASVDKLVFIEAGKEGRANGRTFKGPVYIARRTTLGEISVVSLGADDDTQTTIAASANESGEQTMDPKFKSWLEARGYDSPEDLTDEQIEPLQAAWEAEKAAAAGEGGGEPDANAGGEGEGGDPDARIQAAIQAERQRRRSIEAACRGFEGDRVDQLRRQALDGEIEVEDLRAGLLDHVRSRRSAAAASTLGSGEVAPGRVLTASMCLTCGVGDERLAADPAFGEQAVTAARRRRMSGLHDLLAAYCELAGRRAPHGGQALYEQALEVQAAGFSTVNVAGILAASSAKILLAAWDSVPVVYPAIAQEVEFTNFHRHRIFRLNPNGEFAEIGPDGELKHGNLTETEYNNRLATRGMLLTLTRQAVINDDLNAFRQIPIGLGRKSRLAVEKSVINNVMESADSFYTAGRGNKITSNALSVEGLAAAEAAMMGMADTDGDPVYALPAVLLVPPKRSFLAKQLYTSAAVNQTPANNKAKGVDNPFQGRFEPQSSPYMALSSLDGYSATTWYLLASPDDLPAFQVAYLVGKRTPTIESQDAAFNTLGVQYRAYFDYGTAQIDYRGAVKNEE